MPAPDRPERLRAQSAVTALDFVYVHPDQTTLDVHFLRNPATLDAPLVGDVAPDQVRIESADASPPEVEVTGLSWETVDGADVLRLTADASGDFATYRLSIDDARIDPYYNGVAFSFKAACPQDVDCEPAEPPCPDEPFDIALDTTARDFWSFRRALLDFASLAYPAWEDRLAADVGVMLVEVLAALGDEHAYYQDRVAREGYLATATQRRSVRRHARLVDYTVHDGLAASTWIDVTVAPGGSGVLPAGYDVSAVGDNGRPVSFEIGTGLRDTIAGTTYAVDADRNALPPHLWDEDDTCLPAGATELFLRGHHSAGLPLDDTVDSDVPGRWVLLRTDPPDAGVEARRQPVRLVAVEEADDPLLSDPVTGSAITRIAWEEPLPWALDLTALTVRGNLLRATAGRTETARFSIGPSLDPTDHESAVERQGPGDAVTYLFTLPGTASEGLAWLGPNPRSAAPEVFVHEVENVGGVWVGGDEWTWRRSLLGRYSSQAYDRHVTLDDGAWQRIVGYERAGTIIEHRDYAHGEGFTVRFGDGVFGAIPAEGTVFEVLYRVGGGEAANVGADTVTAFDPSAAFVEAVANPLAVTSGLAPEALDTVRQLAPEAFRAVTYRAVRSEDYAEAVERLADIQRAGAAFRWTGSWLSVFATPDPAGAPVLEDDLRAEVQHQLDRFRQAGREAHVRAPRYADLDVEVTVCVAPDAYPADVRERVREALVGPPGTPGVGGFFAADRFTFGDPLDRSQLEAAVHAVPGVRAVGNVRVRRRGFFDWRDFAEPALEVGVDEVVRVEDDPLHPERGTLRLLADGGA